MIRMLAIVGLALLTLVALPGEDSLFKPLDRDHQEKLYYNTAALPKAVVALVERNLPIDVLVGEYAQSKDEINRFNLIVILDKKLIAGQYQGEDRAKAIALLKTALKDGNPWSKTEAVYALGNAKAVEARIDMIKALSDSSVTVTHHAFVAIAQTFGAVPPATPAQQARLDAFAKADDNQLADRELAEYRRNDFQ